MKWLDQFSKEERRLLVSLPYKTGLWISESDTSGGAKAAYDELYALEGIIEAQASSADRHNSFIYEIAQEALAQQHQWPAWAGETDSVPTDCGAAMNLLTARASRNDAAIFRRHLLHVGTVVARTFHEPEGSMLKRFWYMLAGRSSNISKKENEALAKLEEALHSER